MTLTESSIYISLKRLRRLLYSAQFGMTKGNRIVYGSPIMENIGKAISSYVLAFTVMEKKLEYIEEAIGWFAVVRTDLEFCMDENIIHFQKRNVVPQKDENGNEVPIDPRDEVSSRKVEIFELIGKIDEGMCMWRSNLAKGKTVCG